MSTPGALPNTPYGAYLVGEVPPPDEELVRVGPGTPEQDPEADERLLRETGRTVVRGGPRAGNETADTTEGETWRS